MIDQIAGAIVATLSNPESFSLIIMIGAFVVFFIPSLLISKIRNASVPDFAPRQIIPMLVAFFLGVTIKMWYTPARIYEVSHPGTFVIPLLQLALGFALIFDMATAYAKKFHGSQKITASLLRLRPTFARSAHAFGLTLLAYLQIVYRA